MFSITQNIYRHKINLCFAPAMIRLCITYFGRQAKFTTTVICQVNSIIGSTKRHESNFSANDEITHFVSLLRDKLNCLEEDAYKIGISHPELVYCSSDVSRNLELLLARAVRASVILDNPKLLTHRHEKLCLLLNILNDMKPKNISDFAPLAVISSTKKLMNIQKKAKSEENIVPNKHRIYQMNIAMNILPIVLLVYFAGKTLEENQKNYIEVALIYKLQHVLLPTFLHYNKVEPHVVAKYVSNKLFVLDGNFESFNEKLQMMLKYIAPIDILHDLWAFQYSPALMESRLSRAKEGHLKIIKPWVIRCPEKTFIKSLQIASSEKAALGEKSMIAFLSERLNIDEEMVEAIMKKHPELITIGGARVKEVLDYLIDEAGFTEDQIVQSPLILCRLSLRTIKQRINELKLLDYRPNTFNTICRSFSGYKKFVEKLKKRKKF